LKVLSQKKINKKIFKKKRAGPQARGPTYVRGGPEYAARIKCAGRGGPARGVRALCGAGWLALPPLLITQ